MRVPFFTPGLPQFPTNVDSRIEPDLRDIYNAIRTFSDQIGQYGGFEEALEVYKNADNVTYTAGPYKRRVYCEALEAMPYGSIVHLLDSGGELKARYANATDDTRVAFGINNTPGVCNIGDTIEVALPGCYVTSIGGLTRGVIYYLSTTNGLITNAPPGAVGNIIQSIGFALAENVLYVSGGLPIFAGGGGGGGAGTVTLVSVNNANGFSATVANPGTTPAITMQTTVTGVLKGNGTAISAAVAGMDYEAVGAAISAVGSHTAASDPHPQYILGSRNWSTADQAPAAATDTYLTGSGILIPSIGMPIGSKITWTIAANKTAAGVAAASWNVRIGAAQSTADTSRLNIVQGAQSAAADQGIFQVVLTVRSVGALGVIRGDLAVSGHHAAATGFGNGAGAVSVGFDNTAAAINGQYIGLSVDTGAAAAWTVTQVQAEGIWG
jgi:hypothetical protein